MLRSLLRICALSFVLSWTALVARADLDAYIKRPEPAYKWELRGTQKAQGGTVYDLHLVSQTWQGMEWQHRLEIFMPEHPRYPHFCTLLNTGGNGGAQDAVLGLAESNAIEGPFAILFNIPNQPLYGGRTEDALIVYTWQKYLETGDESWPLHFPMAKAVIKSMDAIQAFGKETGSLDITEFMITGASKRGWTTWLSAASRDSRIKAIAPMVIDTLNLPAQTKHQLEAYGKFSEQIEDYTRADMSKMLDTPAGKRLIELEDPYSYRARLSLPKLLILGTNDRYWTQDALNIYWGDLKGPKWVLYTPNSGHGLEDRTRVLNTLTAFARSVASRSAWPKMDWKYRDTAEGTEVTVHADHTPKSARLFHVAAPTQDFRDAHWTSDEITGPSANADKATFTAKLARPATGYAATFVEVSYEVDGKPFTLSTQIRILHSAPAVTAK
jgi:PhoPQ-activated pathogenicity-related protein